MTKISKKLSYPLKNPVVGDYFVGTDSQNGNKTVSFGFEYAANLITRLNGVLILNYVFKTSENINSDILTEGVFISDQNQTSVSLINKLYINKKNSNEDDLTDLFLFIKDNFTDFNIKLQNSSNILNSVYLKITSIENHGEYFVFNTTTYITNPNLTSLINSDTYFFNFEVNEKGAVGPQGIQGIQGEQGIQGIQGIQGPEGQQGLQGPQGVAGSNGVNGLQGVKGDTGLQGEAGLSAYQIAINNATFTGTESEFAVMQSRVSTKLEKNGYNGTAQDLNSRILDLELPDGLIQIGIIGQSGNVITVAANEFSVRKDQLEVFNESFSATISSATNLYNRIDILEISTDGVIHVKQGVEDLEVAIKPDTTVGRYLIGEVNINGATVSPPTTAAAINDAYIEKTELSSKKCYGTGNKASFTINNEVATFRIMEATSIASVQVAANNKKYLYAGKDHYVRNETGADLIIKHNAGTGNYKYNFPNGTDLVIKNNEIVQFKFRFSTGNAGFLDYVGVASSGGGATSTDTLIEGTSNLYFTAARVLATLLSGISFATGGAVVSTDSVLIAMGKLQKQINDLSIGKQNKLVAGVNITIDNTNPLSPVISASGGGVRNPMVLMDALESESFGDSITVGQGSTVGFSYVELFASFFGLTNVNRAVSARGIYEAVRLHNLNLDPSHKKASLVMAGFNDVRRGGNSFKTISKIKNGYRAIIANQFLQTFVPAKSTNGSISSTGTWLDYWGGDTGGKSSIAKGVGGYNSTIGSYKEFSFTGNNVIVAMIATDGVSEISGNFDVHLDGVLIGNYTGNGKTDGVSDGSNSNARSPYILYFGNLDNSLHTIRITVTSVDNVMIDYFGLLKDPRNCTPLFLLESPKMDATGYATIPALATDAIINELNQELNNVVAEFSLDYPIYVAKTNDYYNVSNGISADHIHPNDVGYRQIYSAILNSTKSLVINKPKVLPIIEVNASFSLNNSHNGRVFIFKSSANMTIPNGLIADFEATFVTLAGISCTIVKGTSVVLLNSDNAIIPEKSSFKIKNILLTDNYVYYGSNIPATPAPTYGVPTDGLVSYYRFNEVSGSTLADSYGNDPFTNVNLLNLNVVGKKGVCVSWSAASSKANTSTASSITGNFSINLWLYREQTTLAANTGLFDVGEYTNNTGFGIWINSSNQLQWRVGNSYNNPQSAAVIPDATWTMVTMVYNGSTVKFYLNGSEVSSSARTVNPSASSNRQIFRRSDDGEVGFKGRIDELSIYAKALNTTEIGLHYNSGSGATL